MKTTTERTIITMTRQRDEDFYRACCRELRGAIDSGKSYDTTRSLIKATLQCQAPQFYVTHTSALRRLRELRSKNYRPTYGAKQRLWADLDARVSAVERRHGIDLSDALMRVLSDFRAPSFYLSTSTGEKIFRRRKKENIKAL